MDMDDDDFGGFGGGGDAPGFGASPATPKKRVQRQSSTRANMYAKSPQQKRQEEAAAMEYQAMLEAEQAKQNASFGGGGFGGFDDLDSTPTPAAPKQNVWGQAPSGMGGIVIPPFVPRNQRNAKVWDAGKVKKAVSDKAVIGAEHGSFLIRETAKGDRHVVSVNDRGGLFEMYIRHLPDDRFMFMSREFDNLEQIVKHLQRNALYNKQGMPLYIDKPIKIES